MLAPAPANALSSLSSSSAPIQLPDYPEINQGDQIKGTIATTADGVNYISSCTAGYIDHRAREVWTSDHCFDYGEEITVDGEVIGKVIKEGGDDGVSVNRGRDWEIISLYPEVVLGENIYSGNQLDLTPEEGDQIKQYGQTTKVVGTATIIRVAENHISFCPTNSQEGDSGGPVWSVEGLVGINSGRGSVPPCEGSMTGYAALAKGIR